MDTQVADNLLGSLLDGRYRIRGRVARGGMATVYTAVDERLERTVAIKIIHSGQAHDRQFVQRFTDEAKTIARLTHPNVVAVYDQGNHGGLPYLVMEYVRGRTLRDILTERRRLGPIEALAVLEQMLAAIATAHRAGLVHRDVKPENVLIAEAPTGTGELVDAVVKVADFGLARAVAASADDGGNGQLMATVAYVAPELVTTGVADPRSDVYSAGIVLFEMLTGRVPYDGDRPVDIAWQHVDRDVPPPSRFVPGLPPAVDDLVARATRREPADRPTDAGTLLTEVSAVREAITAAAARARPSAQPTVVVGQVSPAQRPSWARLPSPGATGGRTHPQAEYTDELTLTERAREAYHKVKASPRGRMALTAALVVLALMVVVGGWWLAFGRYEAAPKLTGLDRTAAEALARKAGFEAQFDAGRFSEEIKKDVVLEQNPPPGQKVVKGSTISITLSLGPERYQVPDVVGKTWELAVVDLSAVKLEAVKGAPRYDDNVPANTVLDVNPKVGTAMKPGDKVTVILSKGRAPISVPNVVGKDQAAARAELEGLGLVVVITFQKSDKPNGQVVAQDLPAGSGAEKQQKITLTVSENQASFPMPEVMNWGCRDAKNHLSSLGLNVQVDGQLGEEGWVREVNPPAGTMVTAGQQVLIRCRLT